MRILCVAVLLIGVSCAPLKINSVQNKLACYSEDTTKPYLSAVGNPGAFKRDGAAWHVLDESGRAVATVTGNCVVQRMWADHLAEEKSRREALAKQAETKKKEDSE